MKPSTFFSALVAYLKTVQMDGSLLFGNNVFLVPTLPVQQQVSAFISPTCYVVDGGAPTYENHPILIEQSYTISFWLEKIDTVGEAGIAAYQKIEESLYATLRGLTSLGGEKVLIIENGKRTFQLTSSNYPLILRNWNFTVILEV